jgi:hypothetical protein
MGFAVGTIYDKFCLAEKDRVRPGGTVIIKRPRNGLLRNQNPVTFLAGHDG